MRRKARTRRTSPRGPGTQRLERKQDAYPKLGYKILLAKAIAHPAQLPPVRQDPTFKSAEAQRRKVFRLNKRKRRERREQVKSGPRPRWECIGMRMGKTTKCHFLTSVVTLHNRHSPIKIVNRTSLLRPFFLSTLNSQPFALCVSASLRFNESIRVYSCPFVVCS